MSSWHDAVADRDSRERRFDADIDGSVVYQAGWAALEIVESKDVIERNRAPCCRGGGHAFAESVDLRTVLIAVILLRLAR